MTDYKKMIAEHSCKPNQGCGVMTICMCGVGEDMADEIERMRAALRIIGESCPSHIIRSKDAEVNTLLAYNAGLTARAALGEKE